MNKTTKAIEDYLETILILEKGDKFVKSTDIADFLNVSKAAVSKIMNELVLNEYIIKDKYSKIVLTDKGRKLALETYNKHILIKDFLVSIGVSEKTAEKDCCLIEHVVSDETLKKMNDYIKK